MVGGVPPRIGPAEFGGPAFSEGVSASRETNTPSELLEVTGTPPSVTGVPKEAGQAASTNQASALLNGFRNAFPKRE